MSSGAKWMQVERFINELLNADTLTAPEELLAESFDYVGPTAHTHGRTAYVEFVRNVRQAWKPFKVEPVKYSETVHTLTLDAYFSGVHGVPYLGVPPTHKPFRLKTKLVFRFRQGLVVSLEATYSSTDLLRQLGVFDSDEAKPHTGRKR